MDSPESAQPQQPAGGPRVTSAASGSESSLVRESQDDVEDHVSIGDAPMIDNFPSLNHLFAFSFIPLVLFLILRLHHFLFFEAYFAMSCPPFSVHPMLRLYSNVNELFSKSKMCKA